MGRGRSTWKRKYMINHVECTIDKFKIFPFILLLAHCWKFKEIGHWQKNEPFYSLFPFYMFEDKMKCSTNKYNDRMKIKKAGHWKLEAIFTMPNRKKAYRLWVTFEWCKRKKKRIKLWSNKNNQSKTTATKKIVKQETKSVETAIWSRRYLFELYRNWSILFAVRCFFFYIFVGLWLFGDKTVCVLM